MTFSKPKRTVSPILAEYYRECKYLEITTDKAKLVVSLKKSLGDTIQFNADVIFFLMKRFAMVGYSMISKL